MAHGLCMLPHFFREGFATCLSSGGYLLSASIHQPECLPLHTSTIEHNVFAEGTKDARP